MISNEAAENLMQLKTAGKANMIAESDVPGIWIVIAASLKRKVWGMGVETRKKI